MHKNTTAKKSEMMQDKFKVKVYEKLTHDIANLTTVHKKGLGTIQNPNRLRIDHVTVYDPIRMGRVQAACRFNLRKRLLRPTREHAV